MAADPAKAVLTEYAPQIQGAARRLTSLYPGVEMEDAIQEASILVAAYAGLVPGRHQGILGDWEIMTEGDQEQIRSLMSFELHLDLCEALGPAEERRPQSVSLDSLPPDAIRYTFEDAVTYRIDYQRDYDRKLRGKYPYLVMTALDELSEKEISDRTGEPYRSVKRHLAREREAAREDAGLMALLLGHAMAERATA